MSDATVSSVEWEEMLKRLLRVCFLPETTYVAPQRYPGVIIRIRRCHPQRCGMGADSTVGNKTRVQMPQALFFLARCKQGWEQSPKGVFCYTIFKFWNFSPWNRDELQNRKEGTWSASAHFLPHTHDIKRRFPKMGSHETINAWKWFSLVYPDITRHITIQNSSSKPFKTLLQCVHAVQKEVDDALRLLRQLRTRTLQ